MMHLTIFNKYLVLLLIIVISFGCEKEKPTVVISDVILFQEYPSQASITAIVEDDGGKNVTQRGIVINKTGSPTIDNYLDYIIYGDGIGKFSCLINSLEQKTEYYVRAYAINSIGTGYSGEYNFTTYKYDIKNPCEETATVTDYDGHVYKTVRIGDQCWMAENLRSIHYSDGESITGDYSVNHNKDTVYGKLYNWHAVMYDDTIKTLDTIGVQGICPDGWHLPSTYEMQELFRYFGDDAGAYLKEIGTKHWKAPNEGANNMSGFTALPAGYMDNNYDNHAIGEEAVFWTWNGNYYHDYFSTYILRYNSKKVIRDQVSRKSYYALSVRCIKDK